MRVMMEIPDQMLWDAITRVKSYIPYLTYEECASLLAGFLIDLGGDLY
jgi:hypothetical protein